MLLVVVDADVPAVFEMLLLRIVKSEEEISAEISVMQNVVVVVVVARHHFQALEPLDFFSKNQRLAF